VIDISGGDSRLVVVGDNGTEICVLGAGPSGGNLYAVVAAVNSSTQARLSSNASTTVTDAQIAIGTMSADGIHPTPRGHYLMSQAINVELL